MRIIWKDSKIKSQRHQYRKKVISRYRGGWIVDIPGDSNIYASIDCACNAIDAFLGGKTRKDAAGRHKKGIRIIGQL